MISMEAYWPHKHVTSFFLHNLFCITCTFSANFTLFILQILHFLSTEFSLFLITEPVLKFKPNVYLPCTLTVEVVDRLSSFKIIITNTYLKTLINFYILISNSPLPYKGKIRAFKYVMVFCNYNKSQI